jgi:hypothetical protein
VCALLRYLLIQFVQTLALHVGLHTGLHYHHHFLFSTLSSEYVKVSEKE